MEKIEEQSKVIEGISLKHDSYYNKILEIIPVVKQYIIDRNLIIYGGTALNYLLMLKGDAIYPVESLATPDLDFYSPDSVGDAYHLTDIVWSKGNTEARCIRAGYVQTMRVDIGGKHFIADITYVAPEIFASLPFITYEGMRIIHPNYQRIDLHRSLSFPFENQPLEAIFHRAKDIPRFNKLARAYPMEDLWTKNHKFEMRTVPHEYSRDIMGGAVAYALACRWYEEICGRKPRFNLSCAVDKTTITIPTIAGEYQCFDHEFHCPDSGVKYEAYASILPKRCEFEADGIRIVRFSTNNKVISIASWQNMRFLSFQPLCFTLLAHCYVKPQFAPYYTKLYMELMCMLPDVEKVLKSADETRRNELIDKSPFFIPASYYGAENMSESAQINMKTLLAERDGQRADILMPQAYTPGKSANKPGPFLYNESEYFRKRGTPI